MQNPRGPQRTDDYWKGAVAEYAGLYSVKELSVKRFVSGFLDSRTEAMLELLDVPPDPVLLDVACGTGAHMALLAPRCREIVGVDYSAPMLEVSRELLSRLPVTNWKLHLADAHDLPFPDAHFDAVVSMGLLDYVISPERVLGECRRVVKPGGSIVFSIPKKPSMFAFLRTAPGNAIKRRFFGLPPVGNAKTRRQLDDLVKAADLDPVRTTSVWTTMWIVQARRRAAA